MTMINPVTLAYQTVVIFTACGYVLGLKTKWRYYILGALVTFAFGCLGIAIDNMMIRFLSMNIGVFVTLILCCKGDMFSKALAWILPALTTTVFVDIPLTFIMRNKYQQTQVTNPAIYSFLDVFWANFAFFIVMIPTTIVARLVVQKIRSKGRVLFSFFYCIQLTVFILFYLQIQQTITVMNFRAMMKLYAPVVLYFIALVSTVLFFIAMQKNESLAEYNRLLLRFQQDREDYYHTLTSNIDSIKKYRHDIANHLQTVRVLIERNEMQTAKEYFGKLQKKYDDLELGIYSNDPLLDAVLHNKSVAAQSQGVRLTVNAAKDLALGSEKIAVAGIVANLLDNALEACAGLATEQERQISVTISAAGGCIRIVVVNPYTAEQKTAVPKDDAYEHGQGLAIVRNLCESRAGELTLSKDGRIFCACAELESKETDNMLKIISNA